MKRFLESITSVLDLPAVRPLEVSPVQADVGRRGGQLRAGAGAGAADCTPSLPPYTVTCNDWGGQPAAPELLCSWNTAEAAGVDSVAAVSAQLYPAVQCSLQSWPLQQTTCRAGRCSQAAARGDCTAGPV